MVKSPMPAKNSPTTDCVLLRLILRLAKTTALPFIFPGLPFISSAGRLEQFLQRIVELTHLGDQDISFWTSFFRTKPASSGVETFRT